MKCNRNLDKEMWLHKTHWSQYTMLNPPSSLYLPFTTSTLHVSESLLMSDMQDMKDKIKPYM